MAIKLSLEPLYKKFLNELCKEIPLNLNYNCKYNEKQILGPIVYASVENVYLETLNDELKNKPNSDSIFVQLKRLGWKQILEVFQKMIKENYLSLRRMYRLVGKVRMDSSFWRLIFTRISVDFFGIY